MTSVYSDSEAITVARTHSEARTPSEESERRAHLTNKNPTQKQKPNSEVKTYPEEKNLTHNRSILAQAKGKRTNARIAFHFSQMVQQTHWMRTGRLSNELEPVRGTDTAG